MNKSRATLILIFFFIAFFVLVAKLYKIQIVEHDTFKYYARRQQFKPKIIKAERGSIFDRNKKLFAYSKNTVSFYVDNRMSKEKVSDSTIAEKFSRVFGKPASFYLKLLDSSRNQVCLERKVEKKYALKLRNFIVDRLYQLDEETRVYPYGKLAAHIIGYVDKSNIGRSGIEREFQNLLRGKDGRVIIERDVTGKMISIDKSSSVPPVNGKNIELTIDEEIQKILEEELVKGVTKYKGKAGVGIVVNPNNGEILALANYPDFDPANYNLYKLEDQTNRAVSFVYEPGSTMKPITLAMLFEKHLATEDETINTENGSFKFLNIRRIKDTHPHKFLKVKEVLWYSSNIGIAKLSLRIGKKDFYRYLRSFGFGNITGVALPGESAGMLKPPSGYSKISKAFIAHGYEISVTPLQMSMAYSALVNGGKLFKPLLVKKILTQSGKAIREYKPMVIRRVISPKTSERIKDLMVGVVEKGTGKKARLKDLFVGGKTGTSQKLIKGKYSSFYYNSSFIGFFPAEEPRYVVLILVDSPQVGRYGGLVAAPIFRNVARRIEDYDFSLNKYRHTINRSLKIKNVFLEEIVKNQMSGGFVASDPSNRKNQKKYRKNGRLMRMPNLQNKPLRKAIAELTQTGLKVRIVGAGRVIWQSIPPGAKIFRGRQIILKCSR